MPFAIPVRLMLRPSALARIQGDGAWLIERRTARLILFPIRPRRPIRS